MKLTKTLKRFWNMQKQTGGFTLVELIVVIAILAILAGVAIPAYSGYITKANEAADQQLLSAVNRAFAAACVDNAINPYTLTAADASAIINSGKKVEIKKPAAIIEDFNTYFAGNENATFKVIKALTFNSEKGCFEEALGQSMALPGGGQVYLTNEQLTLLQGSTYASDIGGLMGQVDNVSGLVYDLLEGTGKTSEIIQGFTGSDEYKLKMIAALGGTYDPNSTKTVAEQYSDVFGDYTKQKAKEQAAAKLGISVEDLDTEWNDDHFDAYNDALGAVTDQTNKNMLIMGVAQNASKQNATGVMDIINGTNPKGTLIANMTGTNSADGMGQAALVYGAFTAYAMADGSGASQAAKDAIKDSEDPTAVFDCMTGDELANFQKYMATTQGQKDLDACIEAMGVINTTSKDTEAVGGLLANGFANDEFVGALEGLLGND